MKKQSRTRWFTLAMVVLFLFTACKLPSTQTTPEQPPQIDQSEQDLADRAAALSITETMIALDAVVAQTLAAAQAEAQVTEAVLPASEATDTLPATEPPPPAPPSDTPAPTETHTLAPPSPTPSETLTPTPEFPTAYVKENTFCRSGPGKMFDYIFIASMGATLEIVSSTTLYDYVIVKNPEKPGSTCWLYTYYVDIHGSLDGLPVVTPPPTPTPTLNFSLAFHLVDSCGIWDPGFKVTNTGALAFKSYQVQVTDENTATTIQSVANNFNRRSGCAVVESIPELAVDGTGYVFAGSFSYNPAGHSLKATVTLCTGLNQTGTCVTKSLTFTP